MIPLARFLISLARRQEHIQGWHQPAFSLSLAVTGLALVLISGGLHGAGWVDAGISLPLLWAVYVALVAIGVFLGQLILALFTQFFVSF